MLSSCSFELKLCTHTGTPIQSLLMHITICVRSVYLLEESFAFTLMRNQSNVTMSIMFCSELTLEQLSAAHSHNGQIV